MAVQHMLIFQLLFEHPLPNPYQITPCAHGGGQDPFFTFWNWPSNGAVGDGLEKRQPILPLFGDMVSSYVVSNQICHIFFPLY